MAYNHTQHGKWVLYMCAAFVVYFWILWIKTGFDLGIILSFVLVIGILWSFRALNVQVDKKELRIKFGWFKKKYLLKDIASVKKVRNHWYHGLGIKYWGPKRMWLYTISGLDAVEIKLKNGALRRIGTDEPKELESAIKKAIK